MLDFNLAVILIFIVFLLGFIAYFVPFVGIIGVMIWMMILLNLAITPTVIIGLGFNATSGETYIITQQILELRALSVISIFVCCAGIILGVEKRI